MASGNGLAVGNTKIVNPTGPHKATIVWLHDIGRKGIDSAQFVSSLNLPNVKWICPTAPNRPVTFLGGTQTTAWCDVKTFSENMEEDLASFNSIAVFVANLLSGEPNNVTIGIGGIGVGAAVALYFSSCWASGWQPIRLRVVVAINGWLPGRRNLENNMAAYSGAASLPILITHGTSDQIVPYTFGYNCAASLRRAGFPIMFREIQGDHHSSVPQVINDVRVCLTTYLQL